MKTICFFNNKGGVGKTTLTGNIAAFLALKRKHRVLVVDCDPQCNLTQLILGDEKVIQAYWDESAKTLQPANTLLNIVQPILDGGAEINSEIEPIPMRENRFGVDLIPGHPQFSLMEDPLSLNWTQLLNSTAGPFRISNWLHFFLKKIQNKYDFALIDVGPSLGSINRSVLLSCDYFITPLGADIFSILGARNIESWMSKWVQNYSRGIDAIKDNEASILQRYEIPEAVKISQGYIGYTLQQYIAKRKKGVRRPTKAFEHVLENVPNEIDRSLTKFLPESLNPASAKLGDVPSLYSLIPLSQSGNAPIFDLKSSDGLVGSQYKSANDYGELISQLVGQILRNIGDD